MAVLIDTSFLLAAMYAKDQYFAKAMAAQAALLGTERVVPIAVVQEVFFMTAARMSYGRAIGEFERLQSSAFKIAQLTPEDMVRMAEIMRQYTSAAFDYTDCAMTALSERLNITQLYTFDHRDFSIFRPKHCQYLELLPAN